MVPKSFRCGIGWREGGKDRDKQGDGSDGGKGDQNSELVGVHPRVGALLLEAPLASSAGLLQPAWAALKVGDKLELLGLHLEQKQRENPPGSPELPLHSKCTWLRWETFRMRLSHYTLGSVTLSCLLP